MQSNNTIYTRWLSVNIVFPVLAAIFMLVSCTNREQNGQPDTPEVATIITKPQKVTLSTELPGRTAPYKVAEIRPQVNGIVQKRLFTEGSDVKAGQILYQIDPSPFQAALESALASLNKAEVFLPTAYSRAERYKALLANKAISEQDYDDAKAVLDQAKAEIEYWRANVEIARINLGYCKVAAPISGRIGKSNVTEGAIVTAYQPLALATIQQLDPIYVDVPQSSAELLRLKCCFNEGRLRDEEININNVKLILEDGSPYPLEGILQFRDITVDPSTGSVILRIIFPNPQNVLLPGMFVQSIIKEGVNNNAILVPQEGIFRDYKGNPVTYIVNKNNIVEKRMLTLDRTLGDKWLILTGLVPGEQVIIEGVQRVRPGSTVKVIPMENSNEKKSPEHNNALQENKITS